MDIYEEGSSPRAPLSLVLLTALVYVAGFVTVGAWFALLLLEPRAAPASATTSRGFAPCSVCGVVERVDAFERGAVALSGDQGEGFVLLLAALGGRRNADGAPGRIYETAVLHDDGSVRVVRDSSAPQWQRGDRVRVMRGRIEPEPDSLRPARAAGAPRAANAAAAAGAAPAGRTPSPVLPVARAP